MVITKTQLAHYLGCDDTEIIEAEQWTKKLITENFPLVLNRLDLINTVAVTNFSSRVKMHIVAAYVKTVLEIQADGIHIEETEPKIS